MVRARTGLTDEQVVALREALADNRRPRVALQANQFGADARGQIVAVGDPAVDGAEFLSVRVKLGGVSDTLTFSPEELTLPTRAGRSAPDGRSTTTGRSPTTGRSATAGRPAAAAAPKSGRSAPPLPTPLLAAPPLPPNGSDAALPATKVVADRPRRAGGKRRAPAPISISVSSSGQAWTMSATRGGRVLVKGSPVAAGVVTAVVDLFAESGLQEAVAEINEVALIEAQERADALRKELAAVESLLQAHRRPAASAGSSERRKSR